MKLNTDNPANPTFGFCVSMLDAPEKELVRTELDIRSSETGHTDLYQTLIDGLQLPDGQDVVMEVPGENLLPDEAAAEKLYWGSKAQGPRMQDPVARLYCHLSIRFIQLEIRARGRHRGNAA